MDSAFEFLDFSQWRHGGTAARTEFVQSVRRIFSSSGFFRLRNHGIPETLILRTRELMAEFFALSAEQRMQYHYPRSDGQLGYTPLDTEQAVGAKLPDHKHFIMFGDRTILPDIAEVPGLAGTSLELFYAYHSLYGQFMEAIALALWLDPGYFDQCLGNSSLRLIHYPATDHPATGEDESAATAVAADTAERGGNAIGLCNEPHTDIDALTLLHSSQPGLQLWSGGRWVPVPCEHDSLVVNCGDMLEHQTGGRYKSGIHRVVCPPGVDRYSMPFFGHYKPETTIVPFARLGTSDLNRFRHKTSMEYLLYRLEQIKLRKAAKRQDAS